MTKSKKFQDGGSVKSSKFETVPLDEDDVTKVGDHDVTELEENGITKVAEIGKEDD